MMWKRAGSVAAIAVLAAASAIATSSPANAFQIFFGEDINTNPDNESNPLTVFPEASSAEAEFLSHLSGVGTETFEGFPLETGAPVELLFPGAGAATLNGTGAVRGAAPTVGRYPISGTQFWEADADQESFSIAFSDEIAAFGFYGVDIGDFGGQLELILTLASGETETVSVPNTIGSNASTGGSVLYFGLIAESPDELFTNVAFDLTDREGDVFAFDNLTIGSLAQVVPPDPPMGVSEPATILGVLAIGALGLRARRKQSRRQT